MLGRSPSSIPASATHGSRPTRVVPPRTGRKRLKAGPWTGRYYIAGPAQLDSGCRDRLRRWPNKLGRGWSPLLIGEGCASVLWPDDALMHVCPETILMGRRPLRERWARCRGGHRRRRRLAGGRRFPIPGRVPISNARRIFGHWEPTASSNAAPRWSSSWPASFGQDRRRERRGAAGRLAAAGRRVVSHARQRHRVRPPRDGHVLRRPVLAGSGKQREPQRHDPPVSAQTLRIRMDWQRRSGRSSINNRPMRVLGYRTPAGRSPTNC